MLRALREMIEGYVFDPSFVDVVLWFPHLSWIEFGASLSAVLCWRWVSDRIEQAVMQRIRRGAAFMLMRLALLLRPRAAQRGAAPGAPKLSNFSSAWAAKDAQAASPAGQI